MKKVIKSGENLSKILTKEHEGKWIAFSSDKKKIVDFSDDLSNLVKRVGTTKVIYMKPLHSDTTYCFNGLVSL